MISSKLGNSLTVKAICGFVVSILPIFLVTFYIWNLLYEEALKNAEMQSLMIAESISDFQAQLTMGMREMLFSMSKSETLQSGEWKKLESEFLTEKKANKYISNIFVANTSGDIVASMVNVAGHLSVWNRKYFQEALTTRRFSTGEYLAGRATGNKVFHFSLPLVNERGETVGVISSSLDLASYGDIFRAVDLPKGSCVSIFDHQGTRLLRYPDDDYEKSLVGQKADAESLAVMSSDTGKKTFVGTSADGIKKFFAIKPLQLPGHDAPYMYLMVGIPYSLAMESFSNKIAALVTISLATVLLSIILIYLVNKKLIVSRLIRLTDMMNKFSDKRVCVLPYKFGSDEISTLANKFFQMASTINRQENELILASYTDGLTQLFNRKKFNDDLVRELSRAERHGGVFSLVLFDIDYFKKINDEYGHPVGDEVLVHLSKVVGRIIRGEDTLCRVGGEEFAVLLPETAGQEAFLAAERIREAVSEQPFLTVSGEVPVAVSLGAATFVQGLDNEQRLNKRADDALYEAKRTGRNKTVLSAG